MNVNRVTREQLARKLIVSPNTISSWRSRHVDFPQPIGRYFDLQAVLEWKTKHDNQKVAAYEQYRISPKDKQPSVSGREELPR